MDPWLENPDDWSGFHDTLVIKTVELLQPQLRARGYYARPGERVWLSRVRWIGPDVATMRAPRQRRPDAESAIAVAEPDEPIRIAQSLSEIHEGYVDIHHGESHELVAAIEYLSPTNKSDRKGRRLYRQKQRDLRAQRVHLIEVDLLRSGRHVLDVPAEIVEDLRPWEYLVNLVRRGSRDYEIYPIRLREHLPRIRIPLKPDDDDASLDLQDVFNRSYEIHPVLERVDYTGDPIPPLNPEDAAWAAQLLRDKGFRQ
jgi:hypothetical protein